VTRTRLPDQYLRDLENRPLLSTGRPLERIPGGVMSQGDPLRPSGIAPAPELEARPVELAMRSARTPVGQIRGYTFFNLGPVYEVVRLDQDLLGQFAAEHGKCPVQSLEFSNVVLRGLESWGALLQGVPDAVAPALFKWLSRQTFVQRDRGAWWRVYRQAVRVPDPVRVDAAGILSPADDVTIQVLMPHGNLGSVQLIPTPSRPPRVIFSRENAIAPVDVDPLQLPR